MQKMTFWQTATFLFKVKLFVVKGYDKDIFYASIRPEDILGHIKHNWGRNVRLNEVVMIKKIKLITRLSLLSAFIKELKRMLGLGLRVSQVMR